MWWDRRKVFWLNDGLIWRWIENGGMEGKNVVIAWGNYSALLKRGEWINNAITIKGWQNKIYKLLGVL